MEKYELRHNDDIVLLFSINDNFSINKILNINNKEKIPLGLFNNNKIEITDINEWFLERGLPLKRNSINYILEKENVNNIFELIVKNDALSIVDHYWIAKEGSCLRWEEINLNDNNKRFGKYGDDIYIGNKNEEVDKGKTASSSANGLQPKMWVLHKGKRLLLKKSQEVSKQEPFSEYAASLILERLNVEHVEYNLYDWKNEIVSGCENMLDKNEELITAKYITNNKMLNHESNLDHYIRKCKDLGLPENIKEQLDKMIVIDYLIGNIDRHWNNFGVIRSSENLQGIKLAPLFDHGDAFFTRNHHMEMYELNDDLECASFRKKQNDNLKFVKNIDWIKNDVLSEIPDILDKVLKMNIKYKTEGRDEIILSCIKRRIIKFRKQYGLKQSDWENTKIVIDKKTASLTGDG